MTMKYLGLILVLALVAGQVLALGINENDSQPQHSQLQRSLSDKFYAYLENLKTVVREGDESKDMPPLDPYFNEKLHLIINETMAQGIADLKGLYAVGAAGYNVDKAKVSIFPPSIAIGLTWPQLFGDSDYIFRVLVADKYEAFGDGHFTITATDLSFDTTMKLGMAGGLKVKSMDTKITLGGVELQITGLFDDQQVSEIISIAVTDIAPQMLEIYQEEITAIVNEKAMGEINAYLNGKSLQDIIDILG